MNWGLSCSGCLSRVGDNQPTKEDSERGHRVDVAQCFVEKEEREERAGGKDRAGEGRGWGEKEEEV